MTDLPLVEVTSPWPRLISGEHVRTTLVIESHDLARETFVRIIGKLDEHELSAGAATIEEAESLLVTRRDIGLVLSEVRFPDGRSHDLHARLAHRLSLDRVHWVAMSTDWEDELVQPARAYYQAAGVPMVEKKDLKPLALLALVREHMPRV